MAVTGPAVIVDGDTLWVGSQETRIHGIDAPETSQSCRLAGALPMRAAGRGRSHTAAER
jgi:endonuclease YncB( thermonuclease family)